MNKIIKTVKKEDKSFNRSALRMANANIEAYSPEELAHHGVLGMKWGVRKVVDQSSGRKAIDYTTEGFVIKKGSEMQRISGVMNEINKGSGYASFLEEDAKVYRDIGKVFSKVGFKQFDMTLKVKKDLVSPSQKERVNVFLKKMEDPKFAKEFKSQQRKMFMLNLYNPNDVKMSLKYKELSLKKAKAYRMLNSAISGNKSLRKQYLDEFKKLHYDFILDEADSSNKQSTAPIIFLERSTSFAVVKVDEL